MNRVEESLAGTTSLQRQPTNRGEPATVPAVVYDVLRSPGQPLDAATRSFLEPRFGHDFSQVRVHTDARAAESARAVKALAYTVGRDVVFGTGQYSPGVSAGRRLLAHELTHIVQQGGESHGSSTDLSIGAADDAFEREAGATAESVLSASSVDTQFRAVHCTHSARTLRRQEECPVNKAEEPDHPGECPGMERDPGELQHFKTLGPFIETMRPNECYLIANMGSEETGFGAPKELEEVADVLMLDQTMTAYVSGYTDCIGLAALNANLRALRAAAVEDYLVSLGANRDRIQIKTEPDTEYVDTNDTAEGRARNRGVVLELQGTEAARQRCGPEVTEWLISQMNVNQDHPVIKTGREHRWPRWVPVFNIGWTAAAFYDFAQLVGPGKPWDFKRTQEWWRAVIGRPCPTHDCDRTVTLCEKCVNYDVPGNIHFGWVGRRMEIAPWALHYGAASVQEGGAGGDDPVDVVAINIGMAMADEGKDLCGEVNAKLSQLNLDRTEKCLACSTR